MKKRVAFGTLLFLLALSLISCTFAANNNSSGPDNTIGMDNRNFTPGTITIQKGASITLNNQEPVVHIISNGSWQGDVPDAQTEPGAPVVNNLTVSSAGQTAVIGPFNTAGTFHYYCMVHDGMNLTVIVQ